MFGFVPAYPPVFTDLIGCAACLQTKEHVHGILEQTINRAQNNYRLAAKLGEFIGEEEEETRDDRLSHAQLAPHGTSEAHVLRSYLVGVFQFFLDQLCRPASTGYLQQELADDEPLVTERGPELPVELAYHHEGDEPLATLDAPVQLSADQSLNASLPRLLLPVTCAHQPEIMRSSSWVSPTLASMDDEAAPGKVDANLASALRGSEDDSFHSKKVQVPQQAIQRQQPDDKGSLAQPKTQDESVLAHVRRGLQAIRGGHPQSLEVLDDVCKRLQQELAHNYGRSTNGRT
eukprot:scaffold17719_cov18-Tisochrysis_lutea.AAC.1